MPADQPPLSQPAHDHPIVQWFLSSPARGISHCFTNTQDTTYINKRGRKKNKHVRTWVSPKPKKEEVFGTFLDSVLPCLSQHVLENSHTATRNADSSSRARRTGLWSTGPNSSLTNRLSLTLTFPRPSLTSLSCWLPWDIAFLVFLQSRRKTCARALCVGFVPKQTKESSDLN